MATYYLRADGTAANKAAATSDSAASTSMSIATHNSQTFSAGDVIVVSDAGGVYRATLTLPSSGSSGNVITYQANSSGSPEISGANLFPSGWTVYSGSVYQVAATSQVYDLFYDGTRGSLQANAGACTAEGHWYWASSVLYLYSAGGNPGTVYTDPGVEGAVRDLAMAMNQKQYLAFSGITFKHGYNKNVSLYNASGGALTDYTFTGCTFCYGRYVGIELQGTSGNTISDITFDTCTSHHNGASGFELCNYTRGITFTECTSHHNAQLAATWDYTGGIRFVSSPDTHAQSIYGVLVEKCVCYANGRTDAGTVIDNGTNNSTGAGIWFDTLGDNSGADPCIARYNKIYDNAAAGLYCENTDNSRWLYNLSYGSAEYGIRCECSYSGAPVENNKFYNNTLYGNNIGVQLAGQWGYTGGETCSNNIFKNNIITGSTAREIKALAGGENAYTANGQGSGNVFDHNCLGAESNDFVEWGVGDTKDTYDLWEADYGGTTNSIESEPGFTDAANDDFTLTADSPCINVGVDLGADFDDGLLPSSTWPDGIVTGDQDDY